MNIKASIKKHKKFNVNNYKKLMVYLEENHGFAKVLNIIINKFTNKLEGKKSTIAIPNNNLYFAEDTPHRFSIPESKDPLVSIIVPVYNNFDLTKKCLWSIVKNTKNVKYEIIVADDCSTDITSNIEEFIGNVKHIRTPNNLGFLNNCNFAAKHSKGDYLVFLNNDTVVQDGWLQYLVDEISKDESIGLVGSKLIYPDGRLQEAGGIVYRDGNACNYGHGQNPYALEYSYVREVDYISGASIILSKNNWDRLKGFDTQFQPAYYEDTDLAFRIRYELGLKVIFQPKSLVIHFEGMSNGNDISSGIKKYQLVNKGKFFRKWQRYLERYHAINSSQNKIAKDYPINKKIILVIDWKVLSFTNDAGSRSTYSYLHYFKNKGYKVKFWADNFFEEDDFIDNHLQDGFEILSSTNSGSFSEWISKNGAFIDCVYLNRPDVAEKYIDLIRTYSRAKVIYQGHDLKYVRNFRLRKNANDPSAKELFNIEKKEELTLCSKMDTVCYFSIDEVSLVSKELSYLDVRQIPLFIYDVKYMDNILYNPGKRKGIMFVGGFKHQPNVEAISWFCQKVFRLIKKELPDLHLFIVGSHPTEQIKALASEHITVTGYVSDQKLDQLYADSRLVVVPLLSGAGVKGKVIEAIYHKVPVVTTSIGAEGIDNTKHIICIADGEEAFANKVVHLYNSEELLKCYSDLSNEFIEQQYSDVAVNNVFEKILCSE